MNAEEKTAPPRRIRWGRWLLLGLVVVLLLPVGVVAWLLFSEAGGRSAAHWAARLTNDQVVVQGIRGQLAGKTEIDRIDVRFPAFELRIEGLTLAWRPGALWERRVVVETLQVHKVAMSSAPSQEESSARPVPPGPIELPVGLDLQHIAVDRFELRAWQSEAEEPLFAVDDFNAQIDSDGRVHHIRSLQAGLPFGKATASGQLDSSNALYPLQLQFGLDAAFAPWTAIIDAQLQGDLVKPQVTLNVRSGDMAATLEAQAQPFEVVPLTHARIRADYIDPSRLQPGAPAAQLSLIAELTAQSSTDMVYAGTFEIHNAAPERLDLGALPLQSLAAQVRLAQQAITVSGLDARVLGDGRLQGTLAWAADEDATQLGRLQADLQLSDVQIQALDARLPPAQIRGQIEAGASEQTQTAKLDLQIDDARVKADGQLSWTPDSPPQFAAEGQIEHFDPARLVAEAPESDINLAFKLSGVAAEPLTLAADWQFAPSRVAGRPLSGMGQLSWDGARLADLLVNLNLANNHIEAKGAWGQAQDRLDFAVDAPELAALQVGLAGQARLNGHVSGTAEQPAGAITFAAHNLVTAGVKVRNVEGAAEMSGGLEGPLKADVQLAGLAAEDVTARADEWIEALTLTVDGRQRDHQLGLNLHTPAATDTLVLKMAGAVVQPDPTGGAIAWRGQINTLQTTGRFPLTMTAPVQLEAGPQRVRLDAVTFDAGEKGRIELQETMWSPQQITLRGGLQGLVVDLVQRAPNSARRTRDPLTLAAEWDIRLGARASGHARVYRQSGDLVIPGEFGTRLSLERLETRLNLQDSRLAMSLDVAGPELGSVSGSGTAQLKKADGVWQLDNDAQLLGTAQVDMPSLAWVTRMLHEDIELGGALRADFSFSGTPANPVATGRIQGEDLAVALIEHGLQLSGGKLVAEFDRDQLKLQQLEFISPNRIVPPDRRLPVAELTAEPGRLSASGQVQLESGAGAFEFTADRLPILQRSDRWMLLSGKGQAESGWTHLNLQAGFAVDAGYIEFAESLPPSLSDDVVLVEHDSGAKEGGLRVTADVSVDLGERLYLSAMGLDTRLTGGLQIRMRDGQPVTATGSVATRDGRFQGYGQNLTIERGLVNFQGPLDNPGLNIVALRKGLPVEAGISVGGNARRPQVKLVSNPDVPDPEKLSWIVLGRAPSAGSGGEMGVLGPAALALLGSSGMTEQLSRSLGLDEFGIGQGELGSTSRAQTSSVVGSGSVVKDEAAVSSQVLSVGKRLSNDMFLSFEQSLGGAESLVKLTYQLSRRLSFVARGGVDSSADLYYTVSFR